MVLAIMARLHVEAATAKDAAEDGNHHLDLQKPARGKRLLPASNLLY